MSAGRRSGAGSRDPTTEFSVDGEMYCGLGRGCKKNGFDQRQMGTGIYVYVDVKLYLVYFDFSAFFCLTPKKRAKLRGANCRETFTPLHDLRMYTFTQLYIPP